MWGTRWGKMENNLSPSSYHLPLFKAHPQNIIPLNFQTAQGWVHLDINGQKARGTQRNVMSEVVRQVVPAWSLQSPHRMVLVAVAGTREGWGGLPWWHSGWESACQCRGHGFEPWSGRIPHAAEQLGPWATTTEPVRLEPVLRNKRGRDRGPRTAMKNGARLPQLEKALTQKRRPNTAISK